MSTTAYISNVVPIDDVHLHPVATASSSTSNANNGRNTLHLHDVMEPNGCNENASGNASAELLHKLAMIDKTLDFLNARIDGLFGYSSLDAVAAPVDRIESASERKENIESSTTVSYVNGENINDYSSGGLQRKITSINKCLVSVEALLDRKFAV